MGKYSKLQGTSASGGRVPFMERADANYVVAHKQSGIKSDRNGNDYWYVDFVILSNGGMAGAAEVGSVRRQMFVYGTADFDFVQGQRKAVLLAFEGMEEDIYDTLTEDQAVDLADTYFPCEFEDKKPCLSTPEDTTIARLRTYKHESRKGNAITGHAWSPAEDDDATLSIPKDAFAA